MSTKNYCDSCGEETATGHREGDELIQWGGHKLRIKFEIGTDQGKGMIAGCIDLCRSCVGRMLLATDIATAAQDREPK